MDDAKKLENMREKLVTARKNWKELMDKNFKDIEAHQRLMYKLYCLIDEKDDPEMNSSAVTKALNDYFNEVGYLDIPDLIGQINTYY